MPTQKSNGFDSAGQNVSVKLDGGTLLIAAQLNVDGRPSASGKSIVLGTTGGAAKLPGGERLNLTVYKPRS